MTIRSVVVLTGAGVSAESGIKTFRAADGLWESHRIEDVATPEGFARDPHLVHRFYNERRQQLLSAQPNAAHLALAAFEQSFSGEVLIITQNIDNLHERAGSKQLVHLHGELLKVRCLACLAVSSVQEDVSVASICPRCKQAGQLRPDIVWFGEMPYHLARIEEALSCCTLFVAIGTSGQVYPAAGFVQCARACGAHCVELNLDKSMTSRAFDAHYHGPATQVVPAFFSSITP